MRRLLALLLIIALGAGGFFLYQRFFAGPPVEETPPPYVRLRVTGETVVSVETEDEVEKEALRTGWIPESILAELQIYRSGETLFDHEVLRILSEEEMRTIGGETWIPLEALETFGLSVVHTEALLFVARDDDHPTVRVKAGARPLAEEPAEPLDEAMDAVVLTSGEGTYRLLTPEGEELVVQKVEVVFQAVETPPERAPVVLLWEYAANRSQVPDYPLSGVTHLSPTWYELSTPDGAIHSSVDETYIREMERRGKKLWPLVNNRFDLDLTSAFLADRGAQIRFIETLIDESERYGFEGINLDFENIYLADRDAYSAFVAEMARRFGQADLVLSVDVTVAGGSENWSLSYDRTALGRAVDYVCLMTYDEHWASSPVSGSVSSYGWVERGVRGLLEEVPAHKLVMGIPLYTRVWTEVPSTTVAEKMDVRSDVLTMRYAAGYIENRQLPLIWHPDKRQYVATWIEDNSLKKLWLEDETSIREKLGLVEIYELAGVAFWRRGFETEDLWDNLYDGLPKEGE
jgi:spore germination protein YaaH